MYLRLVFKVSLTMVEVEACGGTKQQIHKQLWCTYDVWRTLLACFINVETRWTNIYCKNKSPCLLAFRLPSPKDSDMCRNENCGGVGGGGKVAVRLDMFTGTVVINNKIMTSAQFWELTRRRMVVSYGHFGTTCRSYLQGSSGPTRRDR